MLAAALQLMDQEIDAIVERKLREAPAPGAMVREGGKPVIPHPPSLEAYHAWLKSKVPTAPPIELFVRTCKAPPL